MTEEGNQQPIKQMG